MQDKKTHTPIQKIEEFKAEVEFTLYKPSLYIFGFVLIYLTQHILYFYKK